MSRKLFIKNAMVLTASSLLLRGIGMVFRVYLSHTLGAEGMGLYQIVFSVYLLASTVAGAGFTMAVTRLVSEKQPGAGPKDLRRMMAKLLTVSTAVGVLAAVTLFFTSDWIGGCLLQDVRSAAALKVLSGSLPFMAASAALRGYFIARRRIPLTAFVQLAEQAVRFAGCAILLEIVAKERPDASLFAVMAADTLSEVFSFILMAAAYGKDSRRLPAAGQKMQSETAPSHLLQRFFAIVLPITAVRLLDSALASAESILAPRCMAAYFGSRSEALAAWGQLRGMALPLLLFPSGFLTSFMLLLVPELHEPSAGKSQKKNTRLVGNAVHLTLLFSIGAAALFILLGRPLAGLLYRDRQIGFYLVLLAPVVPFLYLESTAEGLLKGLGKQMSTFWYTLLHTAVRLCLLVPLCRQMGMKGFLYVMLLSNILLSVLHQQKLLRTACLPMQWGKWVLKPVFSMLLAATVSLPLLRCTAQFGAFRQLLCCGLFFSIVYFAALWATGAFRLQDFMQKRKPLQK